MIGIKFIIHYEIFNALLFYDQICGVKYCISTKSMFLMSLTDTKFAITLLLSVIHLVKIITYLWLINIPVFPFLGHIMDIIIAFKCEILLHTHSNFNKFLINKMCQIYFSSQHCMYAIKYIRLWLSDVYIGIGIS